MILEKHLCNLKRCKFHPKRRCKKYMENSYIFCHKKDMSNAINKTPLCIEEVKAMCKGIAPSYVVKKVRTIYKDQKLHLTLQNQWLVNVEIIKSIDNCKGYFLSRSKFLSRIPSNLIFQAVYLQDLFFRQYAFRSYFLGHMLSGYVFQAVCLQILSFRPSDIIF